VCTGVGQRELPSAFPREQLPDEHPAEHVHVHHAAVPQRRLEQRAFRLGAVHRAHVQNDLRGDGARPSARQLPAAEGVLQRPNVHRRATAARVSAARAPQAGAGEAQKHVEKEAAGRQEAGGLTTRPDHVTVAEPNSTV